MTCVLIFLGWLFFSIGFVGFEEVNKNCLKFRGSMGWFGSIFYSLWVTVPYPVVAFSRAIEKWIESKF